MFIQKSMSLYSVSGFSANNLLIRCLNQLFAIAVIILFIQCKSVYCCMLFMLIIIFNILNFKIHFAKEPHLKHVLNNQVDYNLVCKNREKVVFQAIYGLCLFFLIFKLSKIFISPIASLLPSSFDLAISEISDFHERLSYFLWESQEFYITDTLCQIMITIIALIFYIANKNLKIYYDFYTVQIYKKVFNDFTKYLTLLASLVLLVFKEVIFFNLNFLGFIENMIIVILMIKIFFKFKVGNYKNLKRYINILKYLSILKLIFFVLIITITKIFSSEIDSKLITFLTSEVDSFLHPKSIRLLLLIILYYLYNLTNFNMKFQNLFVITESSKYFGTLQSKPYKLQFISYFAKNLLSILKIKDIESTVRHNLELRYKFYGQLTKYTYFKKAFEYNFKSSNSSIKLSKKYSIYEIWNKYLNIFDIYKYDALGILLNGLMVYLLAIRIFEINILSIFYITLALIIMMSSHFKVIWHASIAFCVAPSLLIILFFTSIHLLRFLNFPNQENFLVRFMTHLGFEEQIQRIEITLHDQFLLMLANITYIICLMLVKNKSGGIKKQYTIIENLRNRRMLIIDADEDILFLFTSTCRFILLITKFLLIFFICKETLSFVNISNTFILIMVFIYSAYTTDFLFSCFTSTVLTIFLMKFFSRFHVVFGVFKEYFVMLYGLYFNSSFMTSNINFDDIKANQEQLFFVNFAMIYLLFLIKSLLPKTQSSKFLENKNFKTKYLSIFYNYFVDLLKHSKNVIDSTKIFFVYFVIFYFCIQSAHESMTVLEFFYTNILLIYHMVLYKRQGNVKSWIFFGLFSIYFTFLFARFFEMYVGRFGFYESVEVRHIIDLELHISKYRENYDKLYPYAVKILLTLISLNSIYNELQTQQRNQNESVQTVSSASSDVKDKLYYTALKIVSVFLKEILLFYTSFKFLQKPNVFKLFYLLCYMYYFTSQIKSLSKIFDKFRFLQIIKAKIYFYKYSILDPNFKTKFNHQNIDINDACFEEYNMAYYRLMTKTIFNKIHKRVYTTWIWMFGVVIVYMQFVFLLANLGNNDKYKWPSFLIFNLKSYVIDDINSEFFQVIIVLFITVFEIYFIDILKSRRIASEKELIKSISSIILLRYRNTFVDFEESTEEYNANIMKNSKTEEFITLFHDLKCFQFKEEEFEFAKLKTPDLPIELEKKHVINLNHSMTPLEKYTLLTHNRSKLSFLQVLTGLLAFLKRFIVMPLIIGVLFRKNTPFALSLIALAFLFYSKGNYFKLLNTINKGLALICLVEYVFIFLFDTTNSTIYKTLSTFEERAMKLRENPLSGLPFVFLYTAFIKAFYMCMIMFCKYGIIEIDKVDHNIFQNMRHRIISGVNYAMIDYKFWGQDQYFVFYQLKKVSLTTLADVFFIVSLASYYHTSGFIAYFSLLFLMVFKLTFTFFLKKPFGQSATPQYAKYYKLLTYLNFAVLFCYQFPMDVPLLNISINNRILFAITIVLNFSVLDCASDEQCQIEKKKAEKFYMIRNQLGLLGLVYARNEKNTMEIVDLEVKNQYLKAQYQHNDYVSLKKQLTRGPQDFSQENLDTISVFENNESYKAFILEQLSFFSKITLQAKLWLRKKLLETNSASSNLLSLFSNYLYKNQPFINDTHNLDLLRLHRGDHSQIEQIMQSVEKNQIEILKNLEKGFVSDIRSRIKEVDEPETFTRNRNTTVGLSSSTIAGVSKVNITNANLYLLKELTVDRIAIQLKDTLDRNFGDNFFKYKIEENQYFILRNFDQIATELNDLKMADFGAKEYFKWIIFLLWVRFELIMNILLICMLCFGQGFMSTIYIFILVFFILIENRVKNLKFWELLYLVFMMNLVIQIFLNTRFNLVQYNQSAVNDHKIYPSETMASVAQFLYGQIDQDYLVVIFILLEVMLIHLCDNFAWEKTMLEIESNAQAILRVSFHKKAWQYVFNRQNNITISEITIIEKKVKEKYKAKLSEKEYTIFLVNLIKRKSAIYKTYKEKFGIFLYHLGKIIPNYNLDAIVIKPKFFKDYFWRNFAYPLRKAGRNYHTYQLLALVVMMIYFLGFFFQMQGLNKTVMDIFKNNEIHGTLSINISIILIAICFERYMYSRTALYWIYCTDNERDIGCRQMRLMNFNIAKPSVQHISIYDRLRKGVRRCIMVLKWRAFTKLNPVNAYTHNPLLLKFYFTVVMWIYISILSIVWIPMVSNQQISGGVIKKILCNETYRTEENPLNPTNSCNSFSNNIYLQLLFLLGNIYLIIAIAQIRRGNSKFYYYKNQNFKQTREVLKFYAYKYTPYIRELKTIIDYTASQTSLNLFQWFKLEDIETTIMTARNNEASNKYTGRRLDKIVKRIIGLSFLAFFFLLLVAPLYLFSDILPNNIIDEVKTAKLSVKAELGSGSYLLYKNTGYTIDTLPRYNRLVEKAKLDERLKKFDNDLFRKLTFGTSSESYLDITYETAGYILMEYQSSRLLKITVELDMETSYRGPLSAKFSFALDEENARIFLAMISSSTCTQLIKNRMILGTGRKLLDLKILFQNNQNLNQIDNPNLENIYVFNFNCEKNTNKVTFDLSDEDSDKIEFLVLSENINNSVDLLQKFTASNVSILSIYAIIFSYIGLTLIRKAFFDQAHIIWTTEMPNAHKLQEHVHMINYARQQGDLYSEAIFFDKLIDLFRAPEKIKKLTGPLWNSKTLNNK